MQSRVKGFCKFGTIGKKKDVALAPAFIELRRNVWSGGDGVFETIGSRRRRKDPAASFKQMDLKGESIRRLRSGIRIQVETERIQAERITEAGSIGDHYFNEEYVLHLFEG